MGNYTSRYIIKLIRQDSRVLYLGLMLWPLILIIFSAILGVHRDFGDFEGYISKHNKNWLMYPLVLPFGYFLIRFIVNKMLPSKLINAPILASISDPKVKISAAKYLGNTVFSPAVILTTLGITIAINLADFWSSPGQHYWAVIINDELSNVLQESIPPRELDWAYYFWLQITASR